MQSITIKYIDIYNKLIAIIEQNNLKTGDKLGTEEELCKLFGTSKITIKKALELLEKDGIVYKIRGKGIFIKNQLINVQENKAESTEKYKKCIGLILEDIDQSFGKNFTKYFLKYSSEYGYDVITKISINSYENEKIAINQLMESEVKGIVMNPVHNESYNPEIVQLSIKNFPIVLIDKKFAGLNIASVSINHKEAMQNLTRYLIKMNHKNIGIISFAPTAASSIEERINGYIEELAINNIKYKKRYVFTEIPFEACWNYNIENDSHLTREAINSICKYLNNNKEITSLICINTNTLYLTLKALMKMNLKVPDDISLVCFDTSYFAMYPNNILITHIKQDEERIAQLAIECIDKLVNNQTLEIKTNYVSYRLVEGNSVRKL
ncbi:GntR family transcriptional regulator [Caldicellulosiruptoraceae bacterium PP1]